MDINGNDNCLQNVACPGCGQFEEFYIEGWPSKMNGWVILPVRDDGVDSADDIGAFEYGERARVDCRRCGWFGGLDQLTYVPEAEDASAA